MFSPGEVVFVESNQAAGHRTRKKYHVCTCGIEGVYLFINSRDWDGSFEISHNDFPALPNDKSHIACNTVLRITHAYMREHNAVSVGILPKDIIERLLDHLEACAVMTDEEKEIVVNGLAEAMR